MEWFVYLQQHWNIDTIIVGLVFLSGFFQEKYLTPFKWVKDIRYDSALKTLVVSLIVGIVYAWLSYYTEKVSIKNGSTPDAPVVIPLKKYFISYFAATSLYDMAIRPFKNWVTKKLGGNDNAPPEQP